MSALKKFLFKLFTIFSVLALPLFILNCDTSSTTASTTPGADEIVKALKNALKMGIVEAVEKLGAEDGFLKGNATSTSKGIVDEAIILLPDEIQPYYTKMTTYSIWGINVGSIIKGYADDLITSMNRAAEKAVKESAKDVFVGVIDEFNISQGMDILKGIVPSDKGDSTTEKNTHAATDYLKKKTATLLHDKFKPIITEVLKQPLISSYSTYDLWKTFSDYYNSYNSAAGWPSVPSDLAEFVTNKAIDALFAKIATLEEEIRSNPALSDLEKYQEYAEGVKDIFEWAKENTK